MTWKEIKLATLQKMYSAEGNNIPSDDSSRDYLASMIPAANEGLVMMCTDKIHIVKSMMWIARWAIPWGNSEDVG